jgi:hypothetical protein
VPAIDTQRGRKAPARAGPKRKRVLQIGDVVAQTQRRFEQANPRARRTPVLVTPGRRPATPAIGRAVARKQATVDARSQRHQARALERAYKSQAKSVEKIATLQRAVAGEAAKSAKRTTVERHPGVWGLLSKGGDQTIRGADLSRRRPGTVKAGGEHKLIGRTEAELRKELGFFKLSPKQQQQTDWEKFTTKGRARRQSAVKTLGAGLEEASRPLYATAGATRAAIKGEDISRAAEAGIKKKKRYTASDVLSAAGWNPKSGVGKLAKGGASFLGDVVLDPTTLTTGGTSSIARQAAKKAASKAARAESRRVVAQSLARGDSRKTARALGKKYAAKARSSTTLRHEAAASEKARSRGVVIRYAGKTVGGRHQARATAALGRVGKRAARPVAEKPLAKSARLHTRRLFSALNATVRPVGMTREEFQAVRAIDRRRRAHIEHTGRRAGQRAQSIRALVKPEEHEAFRAAREAAEPERLANAPGVKLGRRTVVRGRKRIKADLANAPTRLQQVAEFMGRDYNRARTAAREAGIPVGHVGEKPPVHIPEVTTDLKPERQTLSRARSDVARAEREQIAQQAPGGAPGPLTPAQRTRATRQLTQAKANKQAHLDEFARVTRMAKAAKSEKVKARLGARARLVRIRVRSSQDAVDHWVSVLSKREVKTKPILQPSGKVAPAQAPFRAALGAARSRAVSAEQQLARAKGTRRAQLSARRSQTRLAERRALEPKGYVPRVAREAVEAKGRPVSLEDVLASPRPRGTGGSRKPIPASAKKRQLETNRPLEELAKTPAGARYAEKFTSDPALEYQAYMSGMGRGEAQALANRELVAHGRPVEHGKPLDLSEGERVYHYDGHKITELDPRRTDDLNELHAIEEGTAPSREYIALPKAMHDYVNPVGGGPGNAQLEAISGAWNALWGKWKSTALKLPSYLMRNATGDLFNGLGAQDPARLAQNWLRGQRALNERARSERGYKWFENEMGRGGKATETTVNGQRVRYRDLAVLAEAAGAIGQGRLAEAAEQAIARKSLKKPRGTSAWRQAAQRVEDSARMGTFIGMLERGMTPEQAADVVRDIHFDYGELTKFEKNVRNVAMPFYTFSARNIPLQLKLAATRPGVPLAAQHAREEGEKQSGIPKDFLDKLDPYEAKQLSVPIKFGGQIYTVSTGAPITDLSTLAPTGDLKDPRSWLKGPVVGLGQRGMELLGPAKTLFEVMQNHSIFYKEPIAPKGARMTEVNPLIAKMSEEIPGFAKAFGIQQGGILDKKTGEHHWAWDKRKEATLRAFLPGPYGALYRTSAQATSPRGFSPTAEALGTLAGVRAKPFDATKGTLNQLHNRADEIDLRIGDINQAGHNLVTDPTPELKRLAAERKKLQAQIDALTRGSQVFYKGRYTRGPKAGQNKPLPLGGGGGTKLPLGGGGGTKLPLG